MTRQPSSDLDRPERLGWGAIIVRAGTWHNVNDTGDSELKQYSLYAPPEHADGTMHRTKAEAEAAEASA